MVSCLFEVIIQGLFPSASWEEVASLVQMLFVRSQGSEESSQYATEKIQANWNRTMAFPKLVSYFIGNNAKMVARFHTHERQAVLL